MLSRDIRDISLFVNDYFASKHMCNNIHICIADYDLPVKSMRANILEMISVAEGMGVVKSICYQYDPLCSVVKMREVLKGLQIKCKHSSTSSAILEYSQSQTTRPAQSPFRNCVMGNVDEASSLLLAQYVFTKTITNEYIRECCSNSHSFFQNVIKT